MTILMATHEMGSPARWRTSLLPRRRVLVESGAPQRVLAEPAEPRTCSSCAGSSRPAGCTVAATAAPLRC